jgi:Rieske Fe-S protein
MTDDQALEETGPTPTAAPASRRAVLAGAGAAALAVLGGCATYDQSAPPSDAGPPVEEPLETDQPEDKDKKKNKEAEEEEDEGPPPIVKTSKVPVGGGVVLRQRNLVVTQPSKGEFRCFSAECTHAGCAVGNVSGGTINCPCHGSKFKIADGSVARGPAGRPLAKVKIAVKGDGITLA